MIIKDDLAAGVAGEHLACADLIMQGHNAFLSDQGLPYDVVADIGGKLLRVQVKTTRGPRKVPQRANHTPAYVFNVKKCGKHGKGTYSDNDVDLFALVALDTKTVGYLTREDMRSTLIIRTEAHRGQYLNEQQAEDVPEVLRLKAEGLSDNKVAKILNISGHKVARIAKGQTYEAGTYLTDLTLDGALK